MEGEYVTKVINHDHMQWISLDGASDDQHKLLCGIQDCLFTQHALERQGGGSVLGIVSFISQQARSFLLNLTSGACSYGGQLSC